MRFDGTDRRTHVRVVGKAATSADEPQPADDILLRPDGRWALAAATNQVYLLALPRFGGEAPKVDLYVAGRPAQEAHRHRRRLRWPGPTAARRSPGPSAPASSACRSTRSIFEPPKPTRRTKGEEKAEAEEEAREAEARGDRRGRRAARGAGRAGSVVLRGAKIITMRGDEVIEGGDVVVTDHRIVGGRPDGQGQGPRGGEGHRRRRARPSSPDSWTRTPTGWRSAAACSTCRTGASSPTWPTA